MCVHISVDCLLLERSCGRGVHASTSARRRLNTNGSGRQVNVGELQSFVSRGFSICICYLLFCACLVDKGAKSIISMSILVFLFLSSGQRGNGFDEVVVSPLFAWIVPMGHFGRGGALTYPIHFRQHPTNPHPLRHVTRFKLFSFRSCGTCPIPGMRL